MPSQTTLILGAGASYSYGFPTGIQLRKKILDLEGQLELFETLARFSRQHIRVFLNQFKLSQLISIDSFLAKNPQFTHLGKTSIAMVLLSCEKEEILFSDENKDHWYRYLVNEITPHNWEDLNLSWLKIVTFNYDRSLYFYLHNALKNIYGKSNDEVSEKLNQLEFHYVYGSLTPIIKGYGGLKMMTPSNLDEQDLLCGDFDNSVGDIKVIPEGRNDEPFLESIRQILFNSHTIGILGFGFDATNIQRISAPEVFGSIENPKRVVATALNMTSAEIHQAKIHLFRSASPRLDEKILFADMNCSALLRESLILK